MFEFSSKLVELANLSEANCCSQFALVDRIFECNQAKVLKAFVENKVSSAHLCGSSGYGYGDIGREVIDKVFAQVMGAQSALVRHNFTCGTHALAVCFFGVLRPGDRMLYVTGKPYDSLEEVIGLRGTGQGSLKDFGITYSQVDLSNGKPDYQSIKRECKNAKLICIQRSRGYSLRPSLYIDEIAKLIEIVRQENKNAIIMVDNCYGEFVETLEPCCVGADLCVGSLIKNPGGGIARTGGYIAGNDELIELCASRLTSPGIGCEVGCSLEQNREILLGLFLAPQAVANAVKTAIFCSSLFNLLGFKTFPKATDIRTDIVQSVKLNSHNNLKAFCTGVQAASPIDSYVVPEEWDMPGYNSKVIMAAGNFTMGSTIESSADGPMLEPFVAYFQGGLTYPSGKLCVMNAAANILNQNKGES